MKKIITIILLLTMFFDMVVVAKADTYTFSDLDSSHWAYKNVMQMVYKGIITGYPDGTFRPDDTISRAEFCALLSKAAKLNIMIDSGSEHWATPYINAVKSKTWTYADWYLQEFNPDTVINRGEAAMGLCDIYLGYPISLNHKTDEVYSFLNSIYNDSSNIGGFSEAVYIMTTNNLMNGYADRCFHTEYPITRAETCAILDRAFGINSNTNNNQQNASTHNAVNGGQHSESYNSSNSIEMLRESIMSIAIPSNGYLYKIATDNVYEQGMSHYTALVYDSKSDVIYIETVADFSDGNTVANLVYLDGAPERINDKNRVVYMCMEASGRNTIGSADINPTTFREGSNVVFHYYDSPLGNTVKSEDQQLSTQFTKIGLREANQIFERYGLPFDMVDLDFVYFGRY